MSERPRWFQTTAIDYPNSRPHIGTAFEKLGADVQARYRRMEGYDVFFLMGNDENTVKVSKRAAELGKPVQEYCDEMARQFREVWDALDISYTEFVQTSEPRHHACAQAFIQKVHDAGYIRKSSYEGWYCEGCEAFKTEKELVAGKCPLHENLTAVRRSEPCYFFELSKFQDWLLAFYEANPDFIRPESRRNEIITLIKNEGLQDVNITRRGEDWGVRVPFDPEFTVYVWFDALLTYITGIGYGADDAEFRKWWPADVHFIGKDITRFHCALWPAMLHAAGLTPPKQVFGHGFVYKKNEETGALERLSKTLGNVVDPMDIVTKFSCDAFRYYFLRECPFPSDGEFGWARFAEVFNSDLANNLGNLYSRLVTLVSKNFAGTLAGTAGRSAPAIEGYDPVAAVATVRGHVEACRYHQALETIWRQVLDPANKFADSRAPWKLVKTDMPAAGEVLFGMLEPLRAACILLKPFLPRSAQTIYASFNFAKPWDEVTYQDAASPAKFADDLKVLAALDAGKVKPLFPRIG
ncbi:MAG: methionine--tRNA ligase [Gemmataceae bacterium]|nr:methionine--tRNA ligase [Gemmataceae bacterium]